MQPCLQKKYAISVAKNYGEQKKIPGAKKIKAKKKQPALQKICNIDCKKYGEQKIMQVCLHCACASCIAHIAGLQGSLRACQIHRISPTFLHYSPQLTLAQFTPQNTIHNIQHVSHPKIIHLNLSLLLYVFFPIPLNHERF